MSILIDIPAALVASPRPCAPLAGARLHADDAQPRLRRPSMPTALEAWRQLTGSEERGLDTAAKQGTTKDGRNAFAGVAYVTAHQIFSTRSGPQPSRPPA